MEEKKESKRGGVRPGAGRKAVGISTVAMSLKLQKELHDVLQGVSNKNGYINDAVREKMVREGLIKA